MEGLNVGSAVGVLDVGAHEGLAVGELLGVREGE